MVSKTGSCSCSRMKPSSARRMSGSPDRQVLSPPTPLFLRTKSPLTWIRDRARYTLDFHSVFIFRYCDDFEWTNCLLYGAFSSPVTVL